MIIMINYDVVVYFFIIICLNRSYVTLAVEKTENLINAAREEQPPNFLIFLADDLGIGDIGCYGNTTIKTPNIDLIASKGVRFEHNLAAESLCTPSRAAFLTGRYAVRTGLGAKEGSVRVFVDTAIRGGLPSNETTFAKILQNIGYETALLGKWHLGLSCNASNDFCHHPINHGFSYFYGMPGTNIRECGTDGDMSSDLPDLRNYLLSTGLLNLLVLSMFLFFIRRLNFCTVVLALSVVVGFFYLKPTIVALKIKQFTCILMRQRDVVEQPIVLENMTQKFVSEAVHFIQENKQKPFLLLMSFLKVHTALFTTEMFVNKSQHGQYGDNVEEMDWAVGRVLKEIVKFNLQNNTFVYFTSDHGPHLEETGYNGVYLGGSKGKFKGGKGTSWEGGIRVPTVAMWPGKIPGNITIDKPVSSLDVFPTVVKMAKGEIPNDRVIDGMDISNILLGKEINATDRFLFHYCAESIQAITYIDVHRSKVWKLHLSTPDWFPGTETCLGKSVCSCYGDDVTKHDPPIVYELKSDPRENFQLDVKSEVIQDVLRKSLVAIGNHKKTINDVPNQLQMVSFLPWMQMCCNFPLCKCREEFPRKLILMNDTII